MVSESNLSSSKSTKEMWNSLQEIQSCLLCPLCNDVMTEPSTLHCTHSFCLPCISNYEEWNCPIPQCGLPVSVRESGYINVNPQLDTVVTSLHEIKSVLGKAKDYWWKSDAISSQTSMSQSSNRKDTGVTFPNETEFIDFNQEVHVGRSSTVTFDIQKRKEEDLCKKQNADESDGSSAVNDINFNRTPKRAKSLASTTPKTSCTDPSSDDTSECTQPYAIDGILSPNELNKSCAIPSQSPGMSPIILADSQGGILEEIPDGSFQEKDNLRSKKDEQSTKDGILSDVSIETIKPSIILLSDSSSLNATDQRCIRKLIRSDRLEILKVTSGDKDLDFIADFELEENRENFLSFLYKDKLFQTVDGSIHCNAEFCYAVCSEAEFQTCDGYMMARNFKYVLAVACGLSIVEMGFLRKASSLSFSATDPHRFVFAPGKFPSEDFYTRKRGRRNIQPTESFAVVGHVSSTIEVGGPQKSRAVLLDRWSYESRTSYSNGLLDNYTVFIYGSFDTFSKNSQANDNAYTKGRTIMLLRLCGATVKNFDDINCADNLQNENHLVLMRNKPSSRDISRIKSMKCDADIPIVPVEWLEDTITEFKIRSFEQYSSCSP